MVEHEEGCQQKEHSTIKDSLNDTASVDDTSVAMTETLVVEHEEGCQQKEHSTTNYTEQVEIMLEPPSEINTQNHNIEDPTGNPKDAPSNHHDDQRHDTSDPSPRIEYTLKKIKRKRSDTSKTEYLLGTDGYLYEYHNDLQSPGQRVGKKLEKGYTFKLSEAEKDT